MTDEAQAGLLGEVALQQRRGVHARLAERLSAPCALE